MWTLWCDSCGGYVIPNPLGQYSRDHVERARESHVNAGHEGVWMDFEGEW